ncbi:putative RNA helicase [Helianthus annuus]|uniref:RNA helicase n=1 Tax=Helianthus annuus TaxID=4232 RepID=A0A9K3NZB5_HELAN|nr:putative RNA helicase [Helianthus annuus]KAJ0605111.1 putative RNA helicase [Helianthus annuus]KAJ0619130.1 putative RNA helicase [Helianthus annuus]KAJ0777579.1 putative RNA helicase [Helianthus annuus]KAJ0786608.1 putative RNA helicase [Helianthus annuus]
MRELAQQIEKVMRALGDYLGVKRILSAGVHVVVGTPGRVFDMLRRRYVLIISKCKLMKCFQEVLRIRLLFFSYKNIIILYIILKVNVCGHFTLTFNFFKILYLSLRHFTLPF